MSHHILVPKVGIQSEYLRWVSKIRLGLLVGNQTADIKGTSLIRLGPFLGTQGADLERMTRNS